jgi:glycolate oxidase
VQDGVVPRSKLGQALAEIDELSAKHGIRVANVFHAGDGNLHPLILYDGREHGALERAEALAAEIMALCIRMGGSITGEHGVGMEKRQFMPQLFSESDLDFQWQLRCVVDDLQIANRGKVFPSGETPTLTHAGPHPLEKAGVISRE